MSPLTHGAGGGVPEPPADVAVVKDQTGLVVEPDVFCATTCQ
jgi:hypothetical protein